LEELLSGLVRREVLGLQSDPRSPEQGQYTFLQDLLRHVAYETLPKRERREKHLAAADHLSASLGEEEVAEVIASHLLDAYRLEPEAADGEGLRRRAQEALLRAGERAASLGASTEARRYFEQAAELASEPFEQAAAFSRAGKMALAAGDSEGAGELYEQAIRLYEAAGDTHAAARASSWLGFAEQRSGRIEQAIQRMEDAYALVGEDEPDEDLAFLILRLGTSHFFAGNPERAAELTERGLDLAEALQLPELLARGWAGRATLISPRRPEEARGLFQLALDTELAHEFYEQASITCTNLSDLGFRRDRYAESLDSLEQALTIARRVGNRPNEWFALSEMTYTLTMLGRWQEALARLTEIPDEQLGKEAFLLSPASGILELYLHRGQLEQARQLLSRFEELGRSGDVQGESAYQPALAAVRLAEGDHRAALSAAEQALATRESLGIAAQGAKLGFLHALEAAHALREGAKMTELLEIVEALPAGLRPPFLDATAHRFRAHLAGNDPGADRHYTTAEAQLRTLELPFHLAVVQLEHAEWLIRQRRHTDAELFLSEARDTFERLQAAPWVQRLDAAGAGAPAETVA
jgi:tetratricopeptide (TPR) repeat protein